MHKSENSSWLSCSVWYNGYIKWLIRRLTNANDIEKQAFKITQRAVET